jgi:hypothetical protein
METSNTNDSDSTVSSLFFPVGDGRDGDRVAMYKRILNTVQDETLLSFVTKLNDLMELRIYVQEELSKRITQYKETSNGAD